MNDDLRADCGVMYFVIVLPLTVFLPACFVLAQALAGGHPDVWLLVGKWWVFWAGGIRLLLAGVRQVVQPAYTARQIFGIRDGGVLAVVQELGFSNLAIGVIGTLSLVWPAWLVPSAVVGGLYYGMAAINHGLEKAPKNLLRTTAMITDFVVVAALMAFLISRWVAGVLS